MILPELLLPKGNENNKRPPWGTGRRLLGFLKPEAVLYLLPHPASSVAHYI
jgi:hypothetical protein